MDLSHTIQSLPNFLIEHKGVIYLLSAAVSLLFALVIFSLLRRFRVLQEDEWVRPFAWAFAVLALMYALRSFFWLLGDHLKLSVPWYVPYFTSATTLLCSGWSNYLFFRVGFPLTDKNKRIRNTLSSFLRMKPISARYTGLAFLIMAALVSMMQSRWARIPDVIFSATALSFVGVALFRNTSSRRDPLMARLALLTTLFYVLAHIAYGIHPWVAETALADWIVGNEDQVGNKIEKMDLIVFFIALPLKCGLFFPGYALMLAIAGPTESVKRLLKGITDESEEFLDNNGVVRSIMDEIRASKIELYIKLPGTERNLLARYMSPASEGLDENPQEIPFVKETPHGYVISTGEQLWFRLTNYGDQGPRVLRQQLPSQSSLIVVPVLFHNAIIGCLKATLNNGRFNEADMQNIQRFAALLSPAVQDYREVDALNEISNRLTRLQIEAAGYDIQIAVDGIARITHDILAPLSTGVSVEAGFCHYKAFIPAEGDHAVLMAQKLDSQFSESASTSADDNLTWWPKRLKITSIALRKKSETTDSAPITSGAEQGELIFGKLILEAYTKSDKTSAPTLATNFFHRRVVSNLITETLLNFIRGYLNEVSKHLGIALSGLSEANVAQWFQAVDQTARKANLLWAVATQPDREELLGDETELVQKLEAEDRWEKKDIRDVDSSNLDLWLRRLEGFRVSTAHVVKVSLRETGQFLWLGVGNSTFDLELDYLSPWAAFILRFGEIADTSLQRILARQERDKLVKETADFHGLATAAITTGTVIHQMVNLVRDLVSPLTTLEEAIKFGTLRGNENHRTLIMSLSDSAGQIEKLTMLFSGVTKPDDRRPCSLREAVEYAFNLLRDSLARYNIDLDLQISSSHVVDVPFYVAAFAMANLLNNAKDAIRDSKIKHGVIRVLAEESKTERMVLCHVTDNGSGVPRNLIGQLFESSGKSNKPHGSGLGLYLSARSLREARGDIRLTHAGPDPQTTFTVCFPKQRTV